MSAVVMSPDLQIIESRNDQYDCVFSFLQLLPSLVSGQAPWTLLDYGRIPAPMQPRSSIGWLRCLHVALPWRCPT
jgi:hypothetical protein